MRGDHRAERVLLLVCHHLDGRGLSTDGVEGQQIGRKRRRQDDRCVIIAGLRTLHRLVGAGQNPVDVLIHAQLGKHLIAEVQAHLRQIGVVAFILAGHGDFQTRRVIEGIPTSQRVERGEHQRHHRDTKQHHHGHHIAEHGPQVVSDDVSDLAHRASSSESARPPSGVDAVLAAPVLDADAMREPGASLSVYSRGCAL